MPGSHAEDIVTDYFEGDEWAELIDADSEPDLDAPPGPSPAPPPGSA